MRINKTKTTVCNGDEHTRASLTVNSDTLEDVDEFTYLRSRITKHVKRNGKRKEK